MSDLGWGSEGGGGGLLHSFFIYLIQVQIKLRERLLEIVDFD